MLQIMSLVFLLSWNMPQPIGVTPFNRLIVILNILKGSSYVITRNSIISLQVAFQLILSLGIINALTSIQYLVISSSVKVFNVYNYDFKGHIVVIVNGKVLHDEVIPYFKNSYNVRPTSLQGKKGSDSLEKLL